MNVLVYHILQKPIELADRKSAMTEWREYADQVMKEKPSADDIPAWEKINSLLDTKETEIRAKYPSQKEFTFDSMQSVTKFVETFGSVSFCIENDKLIGYIGDINE